MFAQKQAKRNSNSPPGYKRRMHSLLGRGKEKGRDKETVAGTGKINKPTGKSPRHWGPKWKQCKAQQFSVFSFQFAVFSFQLSTFVKGRWKVEVWKGERWAQLCWVERLFLELLLRTEAEVEALGSRFWDQPVATGRKTSALAKYPSSDYI